jgi:type IV secretion system protein TrbD
MSVPGYRIALHNSLTTPVMMSGVPRKFAILNWTICAALVLGLRAVYILPIFVILHIIAVFFAKKDPDFFEVILRLLKQKKFYKV